ncbi:acyl-CoA dehydrogenase family protein [Mycobacterium sp. pW049]|uniref:acyl-CoA dehydrogenase family protein n=1 Tax=[Mycobacterium] bulgaricum TaxID=3238985 RepID=UPI00351B8E2F
MAETATDAKLTVNDVRARVDALVPALRERARETEVQRGMLPENLNALTEAGVFRLTLPTDRGGLQADITSINEILAQISRGDPSTGWMAAIITATNTWVGFFADEAAEEILATPDLRVTGLIAPTGQARPVDGGVMVSGTWMWNTAGKHSNWVGLACMCAGDRGPTPIACLVPTSSVTLHDTWDASGMSGTATNKITTEDLFVPHSRVIAIPDLASGTFVPRKYGADPYYNRPAVHLFLAIQAGPMLGIGRGAMDVFLERLPGRAITYTSYADATQAPITHRQVADAQQALEIAEMYTTRIGQLVDGGLGSVPSIDDRVRVRAYLSQVTTYARECATVCYHASGASAIQNSVPIQRYFRDAHALSLHALQQPDSAKELYGRHLLGLEPNTTLL